MKDEKFLSFFADLDSTFHLAKYTNTVKLTKGEHLVTLTINSPQTITASDKGASFSLELFKYAADYISIVKSSKDILDQGENTIYLSKTFDEPKTGDAYAALYKDDRLVKAYKKPITDVNNVDFTIENTPWTTYDKAKVFVWDSDLNPLTDTTIHKTMAANNNPFKGDSEINVVYLGDSLYVGYGITDGRRFVEQTGKWFEDTFENENTTVNWYNAGYGGTTTDYSLIRLKKDVIDKNPDVVFVAQTINDGNADSRRNLETIVKTLQSLENPPYIIFTVFPNREWCVNATFGKEVAAKYNIPVIDGTPAFKKAVDDGNTISALFPDGTHPNVTGHDYMSEYIISLLETNKYWSKGISPQSNLIPESKAIDVSSVNYFSSTDPTVTKSSGWTAESDYVDATKSGETLTFSFSGNFLGFEYGQKNTAGDIEIWVDGELKKTCTCYWSDSSYGKVCKAGSVYLDLADGNHTVELKTVTPASNPERVNTRIYGIFTGSWAD